MKGRMIIWFAVAAMWFPHPGFAEKQLLSEDLVRAIAWDTSAVIDASALSMRGITDPSLHWPVRFSETAQKVLREPHFRFQDFDLSTVGVRRTAAPPARPDLRSLEAALGFADAFDRKTDVALRAEYFLSENGIEVTRADVMSIVPPEPRVRILFVPVADISETDLQNGPIETDMLQLALDRSLDRTGISTVPAGPADYYVFAFFLDRLPPDAAVELRVSSVADGIAGARGNSVEINRHGWKAAVQRATFEIGGGADLYFKAIYQISGEQSGTRVEPSLAGVRSNRLTSAHTSNRSKKKGSIR